MSALALYSLRMFIRQQGVNIFTMEEIDRDGVGVVIERALRKLKGIDLLYVRLDLDAVDPSVAAGVGTPVKGGLSYRESHLLLETVHDHRKMTSLEIVEEDPVLDNRNQSAEFAVELVMSALGKKII